VTRKSFTIPDRDCEKCHNPYTPTGVRQKYCPDCQNPYYAKWRAANREVSRKKQKDRYLDPETNRKRREAGVLWNIRQWAPTEAEVQRVFDLWQNRTGICDICGTTEDVTGKAMAVDHCHETNTFRGFLCHTCNTGLGWFGESADRLATASDYVRKNGKVL